ncbi:MAG TPA: hypothetical protein VHF06_27550, partial [Pseudonocardiaceae bacterium]|nr:hypothetical protein [Pseudonocardiaceae bacterium]
MFGGRGGGSWALGGEQDSGPGEPGISGPGGAGISGPSGAGISGGGPGDSRTSRADDPWASASPGDSRTSGPDNPRTSGP